MVSYKIYCPWKEFRFSISVEDRSYFKYIYLFIEVQTYFVFLLHCRKIAVFEVINFFRRKSRVFINNLYLIENQTYLTWNNRLFIECRSYLKDISFVEDQTYFK